MLNELLALKAEAEHEKLYAQAKLEVVDKLLKKVKALSASVEQEVTVEPEFDLEEGASEDTELTEV